MTERCSSLTCSIFYTNKKNFEWNWAVCSNSRGKLTFFSLLVYSDNNWNWCNREKWFAISALCLIRNVNRKKNYIQPNISLNYLSCAVQIFKWGKFNATHIHGTHISLVKTFRNNWNYVLRFDSIHSLSIKENPPTIKWIEIGQDECQCDLEACSLHSYQ